MLPDTAHSRQRTRSPEHTVTPNVAQPALEQRLRPEGSSHSGTDAYHRLPSDSPVVVPTKVCMVLSRPRPALVVCRSGSSGHRTFTSVKHALFINT
jgi:hypothetical protein